MYKAVFGEKKILADHPKSWRGTYLIKIAYGGWTGIRDSVLSVFSESKDVHALCLINLVDNYLPLVLSIYSTIFKGNFFNLITFLYFQTQGR